MNKTLVFLSALGDAADFCQWLLTDFASSLAPRCQALTLNVAQPVESRSRWDAVLELQAVDQVALDALNEPALRQQASQIAAYTSAELAGKDDGSPRGWPTPGVKLLCGWIGRDDVSLQERRRHWDEHVPLANRIHIGVCRYVRYWIEGILLAPTPYPPAYQGVATQQFNSLSDLHERSFDKPESVQVIQDDVAEFIKRFDVLITTEYCFDSRQR